MGTQRIRNGVNPEVTSSWSGSPHSHPGLEIFLGFGFSAWSICTRVASGFHGGCGLLVPTAVGSKSAAAAAGGGEAAPRIKATPGLG